MSIYAFGRCHFSHLFPLYVICIALVTILLGRGLAPLGRAPFWNCAATAAVVALSLATTAVFAGLLLDQRRHYHSSGLERAAGIVVRPTASSGWLADAVRDLDALGGHTPIFVCTDRHDRVVSNPILVYFLSGRRPGVYYYQFDPGLTTIEPVQRRIIHDLEQNAVDVVVIDREPPPDEPNQSRQSSGVHLLDEYLRDRFETVKERQRYRIIRRKTSANGPAPEPAIRKVGSPV